jgi:hypothetical protein
MNADVFPSIEARAHAQRLGQLMQLEGFGERWELFGVANRALVADLRAQLAAANAELAQLRWLASWVYCHTTQDAVRMKVAPYKDAARKEAAP